MSRERAGYCEQPGTAGRGPSDLLAGLREQAQDPLYPDQPGRAETGRTRLPHVAHQLKRGFEAALRLALQWP
jgi:hypothetical protein